MIRILLVDDHPVVRQGIRSILTDRFRDAVVAEAGDAPSALREVDTAPWDVVLLDISMPGPSGLDLIKQLRREHPRCRCWSSACTRPPSSRGVPSARALSVI
jgi:DNA-binding NarL/FixJ family response regulator